MPSTFNRVRHHHRGESDRREKRDPSGQCRAVPIDDCIFASTTLGNNVSLFPPEKIVSRGFVTGGWNFQQGSCLPARDGHRWAGEGRRRGTGSRKQLPLAYRSLRRHLSPLS